MNHRAAASATIAFVPLAGLLLALLVAGGCNAGSPQASGFPIGDTRLVTVGELVELRIPVEPDGTRDWRVSSYDSMYLALVSRPRLETDSAGRSSLVFTARAKTPGTTTVELTEVPGPRSEGRAPRTKRFKFNIGR